ncbi:MAG TPA: Uma2 family endonuclease [Cyclobacteriaceae bacterium]|nr:Uma2 family endonuclease [Cyclobacteriaceae bacterium]HMV08305.1 Uma2 family endonuclease [Cyclobacteriaceae bacterium]HMV88418.1 Uma2 family endonuclease [Cyclobacteriaceae bacterium]HMX02148.1 Uma2 family endonuclease [Cyclobacteriaceae bacterium]HMX49876.1 Uma2 family endonuclease [Cyclobacteriaceae bacterium]
MQTVKIDRTKNWTVEDYLLLGEANTPCQLINGELIMSPAPNPEHQRVLAKIFKLIDRFSTGETFFAPIDLFIDQKNVFQPDLIYISPEKANIVSKRGIEGAPDLIVEILSPSNIFTDRNQKKFTYQKIGVKEYWIVDPANKTLEIYKHDQADQNTPSLYVAGEGEVTSSVLPNLKFDLKEIF